MGSVASSAVPSPPPDRAASVDESDPLASTPCAEDVEDAELEGDRPFAPGTARAALSYSGFRRVFAGSAASNVGSWMQNVVLGQYAYLLTKSPQFVAIMGFAQLGPLLLLSLVGGSLADRFDRRKLLMVVSVQQALAALVLAFIALDPDPSRLALVLAVFTVGIGQAIAGPTFASVLPSLVDKRDLAGAVSLTSVSMNLSRVVGAAIGPFVFAAVGVSWVFVINAATYFFIIAGVATVTIPSPARQQGGPTGLRRVLSGFGVARRDPIIGRILITVSVFSFFSLVFITQMPTLADVNLGIADKSPVYGWLYATFGIGAMTGALSVGTVFAGWDYGKLVRWGLLAFGACLTTFALLRSPWPAFPVALTLGFVYFMVITSLSTVLQSRLDDANRGRVMAIWIMAFGGTVPIGNLAFGPVIEATSITFAMLIGAAVAVGLSFYARVSHDDG
jgi:predicted MFS family arabinose efflux permease